MQTSTKLFGFLAAFFAIVGVIYVFATHGSHYGDGLEWVGVMGFFFLAGMMGMVSYYNHLTKKSIGASPDDDPHGEISAYEGEYGVFAPHSWMPLWVGLAATVAVIGFAVGWWLFFIAAFFGVVALVGWVFEAFHGEHSL
ncbi:cytochrome c oxidase subunit 4 [Kribbia dieselivorans]|uniref:cytochrome c oxidase subunit 4 n=1 Tax=Kribbia dieselivorans TaxID=331526 RepID=UPI00083898BD|nr:cytochrome c oxidase subunit 4 [Kribbia dieselivorans]